MKDGTLHSIRGWHRFVTCVRHTGCKPVPRGFTLVEMIVAISVVVILVTIVVGVSHMVLARAGKERTKLNMQVILQAIEAFRETDSTGLYPPTTGTTPEDRNKALFTALKDNPAAEAKLRNLPGDAIENINSNDCFVDGFERVLDYSSDGGVGGMPVLISAGPDSDFDTEKDNIRSDNQ